MAPRPIPNVARPTTSSATSNQLPPREGQHNVADQGDNRGNQRDSAEYRRKCLADDGNPSDQQGQSSADGGNPAENVDQFLDPAGIVVDPVLELVPGAVLQAVVVDRGPNGITRTLDRGIADILGGFEILLRPLHRRSRRLLALLQLLAAGVVVRRVLGQPVDRAGARLLVRVRVLGVTERLVSHGLGVMQLRGVLLRGAAFDHLFAEGVRRRVVPLESLPQLPFGSLRLRTELVGRLALPGLDGRERLDLVRLLLDGFRGLTEIAAEPGNLLRIAWYRVRRFPDHSPLVSPGARHFAPPVPLVPCLSVPGGPRRVGDRCPHRPGPRWKGSSRASRSRP